MTTHHNDTQQVEQKQEAAPKLEQEPESELEPEDAPKLEQEPEQD